MRHLRGKLTYSNVLSTLCLFLLLGGGTAYAAAAEQRRRKADQEGRRHPGETEFRREGGAKGRAGSGRPARAEGR